jgi:putative transposase
MRSLAVQARPHRRRLHSDTGVCSLGTNPANTLDRNFSAPRPTAKWVADFTSVWTLVGWLYVAVVLDLFSRLGVGCSLSRAGNVWNNASVESFLSSMQIERDRRTIYRTRDEARRLCVRLRYRNRASNLDMDRSRARACRCARRRYVRE